MTPNLVLPGSLTGKLVTPGDRRYAMLRSTYTTRHTPAEILLPETTQQVVAAVRYARERGLPIAVRSGGHGLSGNSSNDGGLVIDLSALNRVQVLDERARLVRVEAGARWAMVAKALAPYGLAISSGDHGNVGVGGLATGGGVGWLVRRYGLTIDHVRAVEVVLADGTLVRADAEHEPELFWLVRGAGAGAGIVVAFELQAEEVRNVGLAQIVVEASPDGATVRQWADHLGRAPRELSTAVVLYAQGRTAIMQITAIAAVESLRRVRPMTEPLLSIGRLLDHRNDLAPYPALVPMGHLHPNVGQQASTTTNSLLTMDDASARAIMRATTGPSRAVVQLRSVGGAVNDVDPTATAYPHRHQDTLVIGSVFPPQGGAALDAAWRPIAARADGAYVNFESRPDRAAFDRIYPGETGRRVAALWRRYDPDGVFRPALLTRQAGARQADGHESGSRHAGGRGQGGPDRRGSSARRGGGRGDRRR
ncbi:FAD-binding oxidoreductase [Micromonospora krabiensis]|uniref:FAD/FMN-containing dehydrogenase n=1 Tax=Micromonospora krabiensis TaxID=307121 RepID=A0A1C3NAU2_9ACTN|nr:FAD-binding oxidoreductase [Micromonospora krabiensis]SBV29712.1 FAD/FMN-containing dehydrogenase [Micromonospora krabiensis]